MRIPWEIRLAAKRAWRDTLAVAGFPRFSWKMLAFWPPCVIGPLVILYLREGMKVAMPELQSVIYSVATVAPVFLAFFLYNFWCAPFKILRERGEAAASPIVPEDWKNVRSYTLDEAASLWVGLQPHQPKNTEATAAFFRLRGDMFAGTLRYQLGITKAMNRMLGEGELPKGTQVITANDLRRHADSIGTVPLFLQAVEAPSEQRPGEEDETKESL